MDKPATKKNAVYHKGLVVKCPATDDKSETFTLPYNGRLKEIRIAHDSNIAYFKVDSLRINQEQLIEKVPASFYDAQNVISLPVNSDYNAQDNFQLVISNSDGTAHDADVVIIYERLEF
jgi:hypothetical protein